MQYRELHALLKSHPDRDVRVALPDGTEIPPQFHVTEVGQITKAFIDCGGKVHSEQRCLLQTWVGNDPEHRLNTGRFAKILDLGRSVVALDVVEVEVEFEDTVISQYPIVGWRDTGSAFILDLALKHTDCLARSQCGAPETQSKSDACCSSAAVSSCG